MERSRLARASSFSGHPGSLLLSSPGFRFHRAHEIIHFPLGLLSFESVALLDSADELIAFTGDHLPVVVREFAHFSRNRPLYSFHLPSI